MWHCSKKFPGHINISNENFFPLFISYILLFLETIIKIARELFWIMSQLANNACDNPQGSYYLNICWPKKEVPLKEKCGPINMNKLFFLYFTMGNSMTFNLEFPPTSSGRHSLNIDRRNFILSSKFSILQEL